jgi:hypothetical protein
VGACANPLGDELAGPPAPRPKALDDLLGDARERLGRQRRPPDLMAATESNLLLASNLWSMRDQVCRGVWDEDDVLMRVMNDLDR